MRTAPFSSDVRRRQAFTLAELLLVLGLVAVLLTLGAGAVPAVRHHLAEHRTRADLRLLVQALEHYRERHGDYPTTRDLGFAPVDPAQPLAASDAQVVLFRALMLQGAPSPRGGGLAGTLDLSALRTESRNAAAGGPDPEADSFVDGWGRRFWYSYYGYEPGIGAAPPAYSLYSAGRDGRHVPPDPITGGVPATPTAARDNADNVIPAP